MEREVFELLEGYPLLLLDPLLQPLQDVIVVLAVEEGVAKQDAGKVELGDGGGALGELCELDLDDLGLEVVHEGAELLELELPRPVPPEQVQQDAGVHSWCFIRSLSSSSCIRFN